MTPIISNGRLFNFMIPPVRVVRDTSYLFYDGRRKLVRGTYGEMQAATAATLRWPNGMILTHFIPVSVFDGYIIRCPTTSSQSIAKTESKVCVGRWMNLR